MYNQPPLHDLQYICMWKNHLHVLLCVFPVPVITDRLIRVYLKVCTHVVFCIINLITRKMYNIKGASIEDTVESFSHLMLM